MKLTIPQSTVYRGSSRFRVLVAGRRFGKTFLALPELVKMADGDDREAWYVAPTYRQAEMIVWRKLKQFVGPRIRKVNETKLSIELDRGSRVCLKGADNYDSLRGPGLDGIVLDEFADIAPEAWTEVLRPMLSDRQGSALFIGTPRGRNHFYDLYNKAKELPDWASYSFTTLEGGNVPASEVQAARADLDERTFRQEYEASFENFSGAAYYSFDRTNNVQPVSYDPTLPIVWSLDFNYNPMCSVICQVQDYAGFHFDRSASNRMASVNVLEEMYLGNTFTPDACEEFHQRMRKYVRPGFPLQVEVYGDATGTAVQHAASSVAPSDWAAVRAFFSRHAIDYRVAFKYKPSNPIQRDRVAAVNGKLCNAEGGRSLLIDGSCKNLIRDLESVVWKENTSKLDQTTDPKLTHISDALGYLIDTRFPLTQKDGGPRPTSITGR